MTRALRGLAALTLFVAVPLAAQSPIADRMLTLGGKDQPEGNVCKLQGGDFHVGGAGNYLQTALNTPIPDNKRKALSNGHDQVLIGIQGGSGGSSKAWYLLARIYLQQGDLVGADSAFTRLVQLAPGCAVEAQNYRLRGWGNLMGAAAGFRTAGKADSAVYYAHVATIIEPDRPQAWYLIGAAFIDAQQNDSAAFYFQKAVAAPSDTSANANSIRQAGAFQAGVIQFNQHDFAGSARSFSTAVRLKPDDSDARRNLAASLRAAGMPDSAAKIEQSMMAATPGSAEGLSVGQLFDIGVSQFNAAKFTDAAVTFEKIIAVEPNNRDALFNLAQSYKGAGNADKLIEAATKLRAIDPLSFEALQLLGQGYQLKHDQPNLLKTAEALGGTTTSVVVTGFSITPTGATMTMKASGREGRTVNDQAIKAAPIPIVVEFLDKAGTMVATSEAILPALAPNATQDVSIVGTGAGITAWRYRRK